MSQIIYNTTDHHLNIYLKYTMHSHITIMRHNCFMCKQNPNEQYNVCKIINHIQHESEAFINV